MTAAWVWPGGSGAAHAPERGSSGAPAATSCPGGRGGGVWGRGLGQGLLAGAQGTCVRGASVGAGAFGERGAWKDEGSPGCGAVSMPARRRGAGQSQAAAAARRLDGACLLRRYWAWAIGTAIAAGVGRGIGGVAPAPSDAVRAHNCSRNRAALCAQGALPVASRCCSSPTHSLLLPWSEGPRIGRGHHGTATSRAGGAFWRKFC